MMAMKMIDEAHMQKGKIKSFTSYCGGLPSPEDANNPLAYKFRYFLEYLYYATMVLK
jgi:alpha-aminoadipic semialdehyde synthase